MDEDADEEAGKPRRLWWEKALPEPGMVEVVVPPPLHQGPGKAWFAKLEGQRDRWAERWGASGNGPPPAVGSILWVTKPNGHRACVRVTEQLPPHPGKPWLVRIASTETRVQQLARGIVELRERQRKDEARR